MVHKDINEEIFSHADLQTLHGIRSQQGIRSDEHVFVHIVSLESVRIAHESYGLLRHLVDLGCMNSQVELLSLVGCISLELHKVEHDLLPPLQDQDAKLEERVLQALLSMKSSAITLLRLAKSIEYFEEGISFEEELEDGVISGRAKELGMVLADAADQVLGGTQDIVWVKKCRVPFLVEMVSTLMATPVSIPR